APQAPRNAVRSTGPAPGNGLFREGQETRCGSSDHTPYGVRDTHYIVGQIRRRQAMRCLTYWRKARFGPKADSCWTADSAETGPASAPPERCAPLLSAAQSVLAQMLDQRHLVQPRLLAAGLGLGQALGLLLGGEFHAFQILERVGEVGLRRRIFAFDFLERGAQIFPPRFDRT